jgi:putative endonuclease
MFYIYILKSINSNHYYIGHTSKLQERLSNHNSGLVKSTKKYLPWKIVYTETFRTKSEAYKRELQIKSYKGGNAFKKLINSVSG